MRRMLFIFSSVAASFSNTLFADDIPSSVAERSGYTRTASEAEIDEILAATASADPRIDRWTMGVSNEGRPIQSLKIGFESENASANGSQPSVSSNRLTVVIIGGIHSGECAGKEALFDITKNLVNGQHANWLERMRILVVPSLSPDSNSQRAIDNRPGQVGPSEGMGVRPNAQGLDLNRDFVKLETPEIRSLVSAIDTFDADVLIDLHTTNGSQHRYELTYDPPHHPLTPTAVRQFLRGQLLPTVTDRAAGRDISLFYYGNFDRTHSRWTTYGYEGRYSTNYMGLRGRLGILSEAYSYATYPKRIEATRVFVEEVLDYLAQNADVARKTVQASGPPTPGTTLGLTATLQPFPEPVMVRGFKPDPPQADVERVPFDYPVSFYGDFQPSATAPMPLGYFIPQGNQKIVDLLSRHGIKHEKATVESGWKLESYTISKCDVASQAFQGHQMVALDGTWGDAVKPVQTEGVWISTQQPLAALASVLLQPESADSAATWNIIPADQLQPGMIYPILRVVQ